MSKGLTDVYRRELIEIFNFIKNTIEFEIGKSIIKTNIQDLICILNNSKKLNY